VFILLFVDSKIKAISAFAEMALRRLLIPLLDFEPLFTPGALDFYLPIQLPLEYRLSAVWALINISQ
jgi:hypothetical protein